MLASFLLINRSWVYSRSCALVQVLLSTWGYVSSEQQQKLELSCPVSFSLYGLSPGLEPVLQEKRNSECSRSCCVCAPKQYSLSFPLRRLCLFWCSFTPLGLTAQENENIRPNFQSSDMTAGSSFSKLSKKRIGGIKKKNEEFLFLKLYTS